MGCIGENTGIYPSSTSSCGLRTTRDLLSPHRCVLHVLVGSGPRRNDWQGEFYRSDSKKIMQAMRIYTFSQKLQQHFMCGYLIKRMRGELFLQYINPPLIRTIIIIARITQPGPNAGAPINPIRPNLTKLLHHFDHKLLSSQNNMLF